MRAEYEDGQWKAGGITVNSPSLNSKETASGS